MSDATTNLIWIDLEMTGLNPDVDRIIEIATIVTDQNLQIIAQGPVIAVHQSEEVLKLMDAWNIKHHGQSGLIERVRQSTVNELQAEQQTLAFLQQHVQQRKSPMCGNSICQDRRFLFRYMPNLEAYFHYRHIDVSTLKELARRWRPEIMKELVKESKHVALDDIKESIDELRFYREKFIK